MWLYELLAEYHFHVVVVEIGTYVRLTAVGSRDGE